MLYAQNGDRAVNIDYVTSLHPVYNFRTVMAQTQGRMKVLENQELKHRTREFNSKIFGE